ncbi:hypothetical protein [Ktedonobacter robiniae]|nr:hypothetical protein [Ktedonobacter robiniae]
MIVFETERLAVRYLRADDFDAFYYKDADEHGLPTLFYALDKQ